MNYSASNAFLLVLFFGSCSFANAGNNFIDLPGNIVNGVRRRINFQGLLGSPTRPTNSDASAYDRILCHPVFQVTTSWGACYMNMEKLDAEEAADGSSQADSRTDAVYRRISLYYMDPDDAIAAHAEFGYMDGLEDSDVRITSFSLGKAMRSAANLGKGLLTGQPISEVGKVLPNKDGGSMRHKIMPPSKQLFYAARCHGRERVGLFGDGKEEESRNKQAVSATFGNKGLAAFARKRQALKKEAKDNMREWKPKSEMQAEAAHMNGSLGIPVFYIPGMERHRSRIKSLVSGAKRREIPLFFNYEDLQDAWQKTRPLGGDKDKGLPLEPQEVEVFNLWDVLTSIDKEQNRKKLKFNALKPQDKLIKAITHPFVHRWKNVANDGTSDEQDDLLDGIVFIPSSDACNYKESITARGNGKARLRRMS